MTEAQLMATAWFVAFMLLGVIAIGIWVFMRKYKFRADATDKATGKAKTRLQIIDNNGDERLTWGITENLVIVECVEKGAKDKDGKPVVGEVFPRENVQYSHSWYPEGGMFSSLGLKVQKALFISGKPESLVRADWEAPPTNTTRLLGLMRNERFVAVETNAQQAAHEMVEDVKNSFKPVVWTPAAILIASVLVLGVAGLGWGVFSIMQLIITKFAQLGV